MYKICMRYSLCDYVIDFKLIIVFRDNTKNKTSISRRYVHYIYFVYTIFVVADL